MDDYKDFFFKHYPFLVANAVIWGFHYLCPGSRHLYSNAFKRVLYLQCARILSGIEVKGKSETIAWVAFLSNAASLQLHSDEKSGS